MTMSTFALHERCSSTCLPTRRDIFEDAIVRGFDFVMQITPEGNDGCGVTERVQDGSPKGKFGVSQLG